MASDTSLPGAADPRRRQSDLWLAEQFGLRRDHPRIAVLIPCHNEESAIGKVVGDFLQVLPEATIYVYDNNSSDRTILEAQEAGAVVRRETLQGKGHVVRRMFADIDADIYLLVDGDDTYDPAAAPEMVALLIGRQLDMVTAARDEAKNDHAYPLGHRLGNVVLSRVVTWAFGNGVTDLLSGYRVFSRRFVKSFPALSSGFETETEFTIHALALHMPLQEIRAPYRHRAAGTRSKLHTVSDGVRIVRTIFTLIRQERPLPSFSVTGAVLLAGGVLLGVPVVADYLQTGLVPRLPTAVLATGLVLLSCLSMTCGLILDAIARMRTETKRLAYLTMPPLEVGE